MADFDFKSYTALYLKNAHEEIKTIRNLINLKSADIKTLHRVCHSLKGQSFFMGFDDIGHKALELVKYFKSLLDNNQTISLNDKIKVNATLDEIEKLLFKINPK